MSDTQTLYEEHHRENRAPGFSIMKDDRGAFFAAIIGKRKKVLDLGCRDGALTAYFTEGNTVLGVDIDHEALARAAGLGFETRPMDLMGEWHEVEGRAFDVIVAGELLEHLFFPEGIVKKAYGHLEPGGLFIGSVPNAFSLKNRLRYLRGTTRHTPLADPTHINQFSAAALEDLLRKEFSEVKVSGLGRYATLARLFPNWCAFDLAFVARK